MLYSERSFAGSLSVGISYGIINRSCKGLDFIFLLTVRAVENTPTSSGDVPNSPCTIAACGQLDPSDPSLSASAAGADGDTYEDYPEDQDPITEGNPQERPEAALKIARDIREVGNKLFKEGKAEDALNKYQSAYPILTYPC